MIMLVSAVPMAGGEGAVLRAAGEGAGPILGVAYRLLSKSRPAYPVDSGRFADGPWHPGPSG
jgi:hypothetical protein